MINTVALSVGGNIGDRGANIAAMERGLRAVIADVRTSGLMETEPVGVPDPQPPYLNMIVVGRYRGTPRRLLAECQAIEASLGRTRVSAHMARAKKAARTADIDILLFGDMVIDDGELIVPHPEILNRRFCLDGLARIDAAIVIPGYGRGRTIGELHKDMRADVAGQSISYV